MKSKPISADEVRGDSATFESFMRRLVQVPHSEIKAALAAEKEITSRRSFPLKRGPKTASRVSGGPSKVR